MWRATSGPGVWSRFLKFSLQGVPGPKGEQGDTVVIDYDGRVLDALRVPQPFVLFPGAAHPLHSE